MPCWARAQAEEFAPAKPERILLLHSYHPGLQWTDSITEAIHLALEDRPSCEIVTLHLDARRYPLAEVSDSIRHLVAQRHANSPIDIVITSDNAALAWANTHLPELLPGVPVVFCGVNGYDPQLHDCLPKVTGVREELDIRGTFEVMRTLQPSLKRCIVVCDDTPFSHRLIENIQTTLGRQQDHIRIEYWCHDNFLALRTRLQMLDPRTDGVLLGVYTRDVHGHYLDYEEAAANIARTSTAPVYSAWDFYIGQGVIGGSVISASEQGRHAAVAAAKILDGTSADTIEIEAETPFLLFDHKALSRFGLNLEPVTGHVRVIHQPYKWFEQYRGQITTICLLMLLEAVAFIGVIILWRRYQRRMQAQQRGFGAKVPGLLFEYTVCLTDNSIQVHYISDGCLRLFGATAQQIQKDCSVVFQAIHPEDRDSVRQSIREGSLNLQERRQRYRTCPRPGETLWVENCATPEARRNGYVRWYGFIADITETVETQQSLQALHHRFEVAVDAANFGIWDLELPSNRLLWDDRMREIYAIAPTDLADEFRDWTRHVHPEDLDYVLRSLEDAIDGIKPFDCEFRICRSDGLERIVRAHGRVSFDESNNSKRIVGLNYDVTDQRLAERENRALASIVENSRDFILVKDLRRRIVASNDAFASAAAGLPDVNSLLGKTDEEIFGGSVDEEPLRHLIEDDLEAQTMPAGQSLVREEALELPSCGCLQLLTRKFPIFDARGKLIGTGSISADISALVARSEELKSTNLQLEAAIEEANRMAIQAGAADEAKSAFLATMSHEIRTPLNSIVGLAEVLTDTPLNPEQQDYLRTIRTSSDILLTLINDVLDYSKIEAGRLHLEDIPVDLATVVDDCLQILAARALKRGIRLAVEVAPDTPGRVLGDPTRLRQILLNLLSNAIKFTEQGEVRLCLEGHSPDRQQAHLKFRVSDTGIGMSHEVCERLFRPFQQGDASVTRRFGGTGLGLVISKRLAEQMNGDIYVQSAAGVGSTFTVAIRLPLDAKSVPYFNTHDVPALRGKRIQILADDERDAAHFAGLVEAWGGNATIALVNASPVELPLPSLDDADATLLHCAPSALLVDLLNQDATANAAPLLWIASPAASGAPIELPKDKGVCLAGPIALPYLSDLLPRLLAGQRNCLSQTEPEAETTSSSGDVARYTEETPLGTRLPLRILVAEDNPVNQKVIRVILGKLGYEITCVENGQEALDAVQQDAFDLVLMDIQMPVMDGFTASAQIHRKRDQLPQMPHLVALTAAAAEYDRETCERAGLSGYLTKPVRPAELHDCIVGLFGEGPTPAPNPAGDTAPLFR
ncbi:MAG: PAS domain-containing protein [Opitutales bacterium]